MNGIDQLSYCIASIRNTKTKARVQATITTAPTAMIAPQGVDRRAAYWPGACCQPGCCAVAVSGAKE